MVTGFGWFHPFAFLECGKVLKPIRLWNADGSCGRFPFVSAHLAQILGLSVTERLEIVNVIWESITNEQADLPVPEWQIAEIERRSAEMDANPNLGIPWEDVKKWVLNRDDRMR